MKKISCQVKKNIFHFTICEGLSIFIEKICRLVNKRFNYLDDTHG